MSDFYINNGSGSCSEHFSFLIKSLDTTHFTYGVGGDQNRAKRRVNNGLTFAGCPKTLLHMNANNDACVCGMCKQANGSKH